MIKIVKKGKDVPVMDTKNFSNQAIEVLDKKIKSLLKVIDDGGLLEDEIVYGSTYQDILAYLQVKVGGEEIAQKLMRYGFSPTF